MNAFALYLNFSRIPAGKQLFMKAICFKAPYFSSIKPELLSFEPGEIKIRLKKRRAVENHLGTVHAIAMCNLAELCAGLTVESILPKNQRWIPKGMEVSYLKKATSDLIGHCSIVPTQLILGDNSVEVSVTDKDNSEVFKAKINMYLSEKKETK